MKKLGIIGIVLFVNNETKGVHLVSKDNDGRYDLDPIQTNELDQSAVEIYSDILQEGKAPNVEEFEAKKKEKNCDGFDQSTNDGYMSLIQCQDELAGIKT